ncbi:MAG: hypothetical protein H0W25_03085, partial [Acidimicrobiia bacterium]|nr:hypothetical protein [Acidimicrobiia bacterium]
MSAVVYCIVVVGSCLAVVVAVVAKEMEDATPPGRHGRGRGTEGAPDTAAAALAVA